jgi:hypothetical protein
MITKTPFQFKILRYVHDSFTGEFLNIGLAMLSQDRKVFKVKLLHKYARITSTFPNADGEHYRQYIDSLQRKFDGLVKELSSSNGQISFGEKMPDTLDALLATILPPDDSTIQFGTLQGGMAVDIEIVFADMYHRLVETYIPTEERASRNEHDIWNFYSRPLHSQNVISLLRPIIITTPLDDFELEHAWKNGHWKAMQPVSFDLINPGYIKKKAHQWFGTGSMLSKSPDVSAIYYLLGQPKKQNNLAWLAYQKAKDILHAGDYNGKIRIIEEDEAEDFANDIGKQIRLDSEHLEA